MQITLTGEYALRALIYMASKSENRLFTISEISEINNVPEKFLRKIIAMLSSSGIIESHRGKGGGIMFKKSPNDITPLEIIEIVEGKLFLNKCLLDKDFCSNDRWCSVHILWSKALFNFKEILSSKSISELARENEIRKSLLITK